MQWLALVYKVFITKDEIFFNMTEISVLDFSYTEDDMALPGTSFSITRLESYDAESVNSFFKDYNNMKDKWIQYEKIYNNLLFHYRAEYNSYQGHNRPSFFLYGLKTLTQWINLYNYEVLSCEQENK